MGLWNWMMSGQFQSRFVTRCIYIFWVIYIDRSWILSNEIFWSEISNTIWKHDSILFRILLFVFSLHWATAYSDIRWIYICLIHIPIHMHSYSDTFYREHAFSKGNSSKPTFILVFYTIFQVHTYIHINTHIHA